jgi:WD40 repeat protein
MSLPDPTQFKLVKQIDRPGICFEMARVPGSAYVYYGAGDANVYGLDLAAEKPEPKVFSGGHSGYVMGVALAGPQLISGAYDGKLVWWNIETGEKIRTVEAHGKWIRGLTLSPDAKTLASVADDMLCKLWSAETGELLRTLAGHELQTPQHYPSMLFASAFSGDGRLLATVDKVGHIVVWDVATGTQLRTLEAPLMYTWDPKQRRHSIGGIRSVAFSPDGKLLVGGGTGQINNIDHLEALARLEVFDWQAGKRTHEFPGEKFKGLVESIVFHPSGEWLACAGGDHEGFVKFFDVYAGKLLHHDKAPMHIHSISLSESGDTLYAAGFGKLAVFRA